MRERKSIPKIWRKIKIIGSIALKPEKEKNDPKNYRPYPYYSYITRANFSEEYYAA